jgi:hypothetical protein
MGMNGYEATTIHHRGPVSPDHSEPGWWDHRCVDRPLDGMKNKKGRRRAKEPTILKKQKNRVACNPDLGPAVVLGAPRSASLAYFQLAGASNSLPGPKSKKKTKKHTHNNSWGYVYMYIYVCVYVYVYMCICVYVYVYVYVYICVYVYMCMYMCISL